MQVVALVPDAVALAEADRDKVVGARRDQFQAELRTPCDAQKHRLGEFGYSLRAVVDRIAMRNRVEPEALFDVDREIGRCRHEALLRLEMGHPVDDVYAVDIGIELAVWNIDDGNAMPGLG